MSVDIAAAVLAKFAAAVAPAALRPDSLDASDPLPAVVFQVIDETETPTLDGSDGQVDARVQFSCPAWSSVDASALKDALVAALKGEAYPATWGTVKIGDARWEDRGRRETYPADDGSGRTITEVQLDLLLSAEEG